MFLRKSSYTVLFLMYLLGVVNCGSNSVDSPQGEIAHDTHESSAICDSIITIGIEEASNDNDKPYQLASVYSADIDVDGNIYILDGKIHRLKVFDKKGRFIRQMFQAGKGPDDIASPMKIKIDYYSNSLFINNESGYSLKQFTLTGQHLKTIRLPEQFYNDFDFISNNQFIYIALCPYGEEKYDIFKVFDIENEKILRSFSEFEFSKRPYYFNTWQTFAIKDGLLWTSTIDDTSLIAIDLKSEKTVRRIEMPGVLKKNRYVDFENNRGGRTVGVLSYNFAQPILLEGDLFVLWTVQDYDLEKGNKTAFYNPEICELSLFRVVDDNKVEKVADLKDFDFMQLRAARGNRIVLSGREPYPHVKVVEVKKL